MGVPGVAHTFRGTVTRSRNSCRVVQTNFGRYCGRKI